MLQKVVGFIALFAACASSPVFSFAEQPDDEATRLFDLANGLYVRGKAFYGQAVIQYREFIRRYPSDERCDLSTMLLGTCLLELGKYPEALQAFLDHQKFRTSKNRDKVNFATGVAYSSLGKYSDAIPYLLKVYGKEVEQNLADSAALELGRAYLNNKQPKEAIPVLARLADGKPNPQVPWANFHLAYAYLATQDFERAIERFQKAAATLSQRKDESLFRMAESYAKLEKYQNAYSRYKELVENYPNSPFSGRSAFGAVWSLYSAKDYENAVKAYEVCKKFIPQESQAEAAYIVANSYYATNKLAEALRAYQGVAKDFPTSPRAADADYKACWCLFLHDKFDEAIASGTVFVKKYATYSEVGNVHFLLGESLYERNRVGEALTAYLAVVERHRGSPFREKATFKLGLCYLNTAQLDKARKTFRDFANFYPASELGAKALARSAECGLELARKAKLELQGGEYQEVARDYGALVEKYPKDELAGEALYQLGVTYTRLKKRDEMIAAFEKLVKVYPKNPNCAEAYYWLAAENEKAEKYDIATDYFERSLGLKPKGPYSEQAKYRLAAIYSKKGEDEKAVNLVVQLLQENLQSGIPPETHLGAGDFLLKKEKYDEAIEVYTLFVQKFKSKPSPLLEGAYYGLGDCYFKKGKWQQAIDNFAKVIEFKGDWVSLSRLNSGIAHLKLGRNKQAEELLGEVSRSGIIELEAKAFYWLANMRFEVARAAKTEQEKRERYNQARAEYMKVVILYPKSDVRPECMYRVAECLEQEGLAEDAKSEFRRLIGEYPENEFAQKAREKLSSVPASGTGQ